METVEVGYVVTKATIGNTLSASLGFAVGMVIHVDDDGVWLCVRRDVESPWSLAKVSTPEHLEPWFGGEIPGGTPGIAEVGKCFADRHRLMTEQAEARTRRVQELETDRERFEEQVRDLAIEKAKELGWCTPGLNEALKELGLRPTVQDYKVPVHISQTVYVTVEAEDAEDALRIVDNNYTGRELAREYADDYDWDVQLGSEYEVETVD